MEVAGEAKERAGGESAERRRKEAKSSSGIYDDSATSEQIAGNEDDNSMDHYGELFLPEYLTDEEIIQEYRIGWECRCYGMFGGFKDETTIKSMLTTYKTIPHALVSHTLQVYSIKVEKPKLGWPLRVYGMVAARDHVDYNRNFLFNRTSDNCQIITADEPYLTLTGPSGAILSLEPVDFEVDLKFKRGSGDGKALINQVLRYQRSPGPFGTILDNNLCTIRLHCKQLGEAAEATILSVQIMGHGLVDLQGKFFATVWPSPLKNLCCLLFQTEIIRRWIKMVTFVCQGVLFL
ncbi:uncharacterized protein [Triticum aestivum]|uniref:uncharacterized protein n=1 Tax=Triticum aestivum TaxID=4565 RepID=UPI001D00FAE4|nr:uncharacterized protein LOC123065045 [Triticum aestivum]